MRIVLHHGDCRDVLLNIGKVDTVITDPVWPNAPMGMFPDVTDSEALLAEALALIEARRVVIILWTPLQPHLVPYEMAGSLVVSGGRNCPRSLYG